MGPAAREVDPFCQRASRMRRAASKTRPSEQGPAAQARTRPARREDTNAVRQRVESALGSPDSACNP